MVEKLTVIDVQKAFREAGTPVPDAENALVILRALPSGCAATGWSKRETLEVCAANAMNGAVERLLLLERGNRNA